MPRNSLTNDNSFHKRLAETCRGLIYISETDSAVEEFFGGYVGVISIRSVLKSLGISTDTKIRESAFEEFFDRLAAKKEWHSNAQMKNADGFANLRTLLATELKDIHVYRIGSIQVEIFVVGKDKSGRLAGVKMRAVET